MLTKPKSLQASRECTCQEVHQAPVLTAISGNQHAQVVSFFGSPARKLKTTLLRFENF